MTNRLPLLLLLFLVLFTYSCDTSNISGNFSENQPPRTFLSVDHIDLPEGERLASRVEITWWGDDPDGYVVAYEICIGDNEEEADPCYAESEEWEHTEQTDTTIVLPLTPGEETDDVRFSVRSIDNEGARDPEGASVVFPIKNTPPRITFDPTLTPPDTTYSIMSFGWNATDPDGDADLNYIEFTMNLDPDDPEASDWVRVDRDINFLTLRIDQEEQDENGNATARVYTGRALNLLDEPLVGITLNGDNSLHIRAFDQSLAASNIAEFEWHIKEQTSRILFINDDNTAGADGNIAFHTAILDDLNLSYDFWDISQALIPSGNVLPTPFDPTLRMVMAQWDHIYFISSQLDRNLLYAIDYTTDFIAEGGTFFVNIPSRSIPSQNQSAVFNFLPFSGFQELPEGVSRFTLFPNSEVTPLIDSLPELTLASGAQNIFPLIPEGDANPLYDADFFTTGEHDYSRNISASNRERSVLYFGLDLRNISEESPVMETMEYFLIEHLGFETN